MTTGAEVKRWTKGILAEHADMVLEKRNLYVTPMRHIYRAIGFAGSSSRTFPTPTAVYGALFAPPYVQTSPSIGLQLQVMYSTDPSFAADLAQSVRAAMLTLRRLDTVESLYALTLEDGLIWAVPCTALSWMPPLQAAVLAAMGNLPEACRVAGQVIDRADETRLQGLPLDTQALLAQRRRGVKALHTLAAANDRRGVAALLHQWEAARVIERGIAHLWEPTPFPLERGL